MTDYYAGHVKRNPQNGAVAIRTIKAETDTPNMYGIIQSWVVTNVFGASQFVPTTQVFDWDDLYVADPPPPPPAVEGS